MVTRDVPTSEWLPMVPRQQGPAVPNGDFATDISQWEMTAAAATFVVAAGTAGTGAGQFTDVRGLATDSQGRVLAADDDNERWQRFDAGLAHELSVGAVGTGNGQFAADDGPWDLATTSSDEVWVVDRGGHRVQKFTAAGAFAQTIPTTRWASQQAISSVNGIAINAPQQIAVGPGGEVFFADYGNNRLVKLNADGTFNTQVTVSVQPRGVTVDAAGTHVVVTFWNSSVPATQFWQYTLGLVSEGLYTAANSGGAVAHLATNGTWLFYRTGANSIARTTFATRGNAGTVIIANGTADTQVSVPTGLFAAGTTLYVTDGGTVNKLKVFTEAGAFVRAWSIPAGSVGVVTSLAGDVFVACTASDQVLRYSSTGTLLESFAIADPVGIGRGAGDVLWVGSGNTLVKLDEIFASAQDGRFSSPQSLDVRRSTGRLYVLDTGNSRVQYFTAAGAYEGQWAVAAGSSQLAVSQASGDVYVVDPTAARVHRYGATGALLTDLGTTGTGDGQFTSPFAVAVHPVTGDVLVSDLSRDDVQVFNASGGFLWKFGAPGAADGQFAAAQGIAVSQDGNTVYVSDSSQERIQQFSLVAGAAAVWNTTVPVGVALGALAIPVTSAGIGSAGQVRNSGLFAINGRESVEVTAAVRTSNAALMPRLQLLFYDRDGVLVSTVTEPDWTPVADDRPVRTFAARVPRTAFWYRVAFQPRVTSAGITATAYLDDVRSGAAQLIVSEPVIGQLRVEARVPGRWV